MRTHYVYPDAQVETRTEAASALRRLAEALVGRAVADDDLASVTEWANATAQRLEQGEVVVRADDYQKRRYTHPAPHDGDRLVPMTDRPISGPANPAALDLQHRRVGDEVHSTVVFRRLSESSPGRAHGGMTAAVFDDVMGALMVVSAVAAYTGELTVKYIAGVPIGEPVQFRAWVAERRERVWTVNATAHAGDVLAGEAIGRFVIVPPERFGLPPGTSAPVAPATP